MQKKQKVFWMGVLACSLLSTSGLSRAEWVDWVLDPGVEFRHEDNLNFSAFDADEESDYAVGFGLQAGRYLQLGLRSRLRLTAGLEAELYDEFNRLNNVAASGSAVLIHKLGLGSDAIWISPYLTVGYRDARNDIRTGSFVDVGISAGKRFFERFDMSASFAYSDSNGKDGVIIVPGIGADVFDQDRWIMALQGNFLITNRLILQGEISHYDGDIISACTPTNVAIVLASEDVKAVTLDEVFGGCIYRIDGDGNSGSLDLSYAIGRHSSLSAGVSYLEGDGDVLDYENTIFRASFMYSY